MTVVSNVHRSLNMCGAHVCQWRHRVHCVITHWPPLQQQ